MKEKNKPKRIIGIVTSDRMNRTISVDVERLVKHPRYEKYMKRTTRYKADNPGDLAREGDVVEIEFTRPLSKTKRWRLVRVVRPAVGAAAQQAAEA